MRLLLLEDSEDDAALTILELEREGLAFESRVVSTREDFAAAIEEPWSAVISDYSLPGFSGPEALDMLRERDPDLPFILLSGTIGETRAVELMRAGANEYVMKDDLARLAPAIEREIRDAQARMDRRKLQQKLTVVQDRYRRALQQAPVGIYTADIGGSIIDVNERYCELVNEPPERLVGRHFTAVVAAVDADASRARYEEFVRSDRMTDTYEHRYEGDDERSDRLAMVTMSKILTDAGEFDHVVVVANDITETRVAQERLRSSKMQLDEAQAIASVGSWERDLIAGRVTWSDQLFRLYGLEPGNVPDDATLLAAIHPDDRARILDLRRQSREGEASFSAEFRVVRTDGEHTFQISGRTVRDRDGTAVKNIGIVQDVTNRVRREEELRRTAVQQAAVANIGHTAMIGASVDFLLRQTTMFVAAALEIEICEVLRRTDEGLILVAGEGSEDPSLAESTEPGSHAAFTLRSSQPVILTDLASEDRFIPADRLVRQGITSGITVTIESGEDEAWGILGVYSRAQRTFTTTDVDFLRSVASIVGQAIERSRSEVELRTRAVQQSAIAELGVATLTSFDPGMVDHACELVRRGLEVENSLFGEVDMAAGFIRYRGGPSSPPYEVPLAENTQSGRTILSGKPVVIADYRAAVDLSTSPVATSLGIVSGIAVPVASATKTYGVLTAHTGTKRAFGASDVDYMQALANILADAMERDHSQKQLIESESRYRNVVEGASEMIFSVDSSGRVTSLNRAFEAMTGWPREDWIGRQFSELIDPVDRERMLAIFRRRFESPDILEHEIAIRGVSRTVLIRVNTFPEMRDGVMIGVYGFARDITEERKAERERQQLTRNLQLVLESTLEGIYTMDVLGRCTLINREAAHMLGWSADEFIGRRIHETVHSKRPDGSPYPANECPIHDVLVSSETRTMTNETFWRRDGTPVPVEYSAAPIIDNGRVAGVVIAFTDITHRRKLELKLEQANRLSSLGRMAATIAHEFNNVLMGMSPFVDLLRRDPTRLDAALDQISRAIGRGKGITHDILRFTQPAEPHRSAVDMEPWLQNVVADARSLLPPACDIQVKVGDPSIAVDADPNQLHQIITNMLLNARDAMPGGGTITIEVAREPPTARFAFGVVERPERFAHLIIRDTGTGMSQETLRLIFEPLFTTKRSGTGLGLAVAHQVVQRHDGEIFAESELGVGTAFHIFLPLAAGREALRETGAGGLPRTTGDAGAMRPTHLLLVEDDAAVAAGLVELLTYEGFQVTAIPTGRGALDWLETGTPDIVVLDVGLPDIDGTEVYREINTTHPLLPVIMSTGHADRTRLDQLSPGRPMFHLMKPFEVEALLDMIRVALRR